MKKIYYIGHYVNEITEKSYNYYVSGKLKMEYIIKLLKTNNYNPKIISLCSRNKERLAKCKTIKFFFSFPTSNKYVKYINNKIIYIQFLFFVLFKIKSNSKIILYHSFSSTHYITKLLKIKKLDIILQVEEIYGYSANGHKAYLGKEINDIKKFNKAIFVNDYIPRKLNFLNKSYCVSYGVINYSIPKNINPFNDNKVHAIYAGTIEQKKLGAFSAAKAALYLPDNFLVDIYGFGNNESIKILKDIIDDVNTKCGYEKVRYLGYKNSKELSNELVRYDIGLSTNIMEPDFANNTFPSKTITYMSHGLSVVSGYAEVFENINLTKNWSFFTDYSPKEIAKAISSFKKCSIIENHKVLKDSEDKLVNWLNDNLSS